MSQHIKINYFKPATLVHIPSIWKFPFCCMVWHFQWPAVARFENSLPVLRPPSVLNCVISFRVSSTTNSFSISKHGIKDKILWVALTHTGAMCRYVCVYVIEYVCVNMCKHTECHKSVKHVNISFSGSIYDVVKVYLNFVKRRQEMSLLACYEKSTSIS